MAPSDAREARRAVRASLRGLSAALSAGDLMCGSCPCYVPLGARVEPRLEGRGLCCQFGFDDLYVTAASECACEAFEREVRAAVREGVDYGI